MSNILWFIIQISLIKYPYQIGKNLKIIFIAPPPTDKNKGSVLSHGGLNLQLFAVVCRFTKSEN